MEEEPKWIIKPRNYELDSFKYQSKLNPIYITNDPDYANMSSEFYYDTNTGLSALPAGTITIKEYNKDVYVSILTKKIERKNNDIEVQYSIEKQEFLYKIEEIK